MSTTVSPSCLMEYIPPYLILLMLGPHLTQVETADVLVGFGCFESPFTETLFHTCRLHLLLDEVELSREALALLIHRAVPIDFGHKPPIVGGELVKGVAERGEGGTASHQG